MCTSKAWVHVPCLMITKIMILIILCHFSSCIILHATKVACKLQRYRDRGCWQLLPTSCHFSSTKFCKHVFWVVPRVEQMGTAFHSYTLHTASSWVTLQASMFTASYHVPVSLPIPVCNSDFREVVVCIHLLLVLQRLMLTSKLWP